MRPASHSIRNRYIRAFSTDFNKCFGMVLAQILYRNIFGLQQKRPPGTQLTDTSARGRSRYSPKTYRYQCEGAISPGEFGPDARRQIDNCVYADA